MTAKILANSQHRPNLTCLKWNNVSSRSMRRLALKMKFTGKMLFEGEGGVFFTDAILFCTEPTVGLSFKHNRPPNTWFRLEAMCHICCSQ